MFDVAYLENSGDVCWRKEEMNQKDKEAVILLTRLSIGRARNGLRFLGAECVGSPQTPGQLADSSVNGADRRIRECLQWA